MTVRMTPEARDLLVAAYHTIKSSPEHWEQGEWACQTGCCLAGFLCLISQEDVKLSQYFNAAIIPRVNGGANQKDIASYARTLLGFDPVVDMFGNLRSDWENSAVDLFGGSNNLADLHRIITLLLGEDPDEIEPVQELLNRGKASLLGFDIPVEAILKKRIAKSVSDVNSTSFWDE